MADPFPDPAERLTNSRKRRLLFLRVSPGSGVEVCHEESELVLPDEE